MRRKRFVKHSEKLTIYLNECIKFKRIWHIAKRRAGVWHIAKRGAGVWIVRIVNKPNKQDKQDYFCVTFM